MNTPLQIAVIVVSLAMTVAGVALLARAVTNFVQVIRLGEPDRSRTADPVARTRTLVVEFLGHTRMARLPLVAVAHWFTMVGFGFLFFTLVTAYGQIFDPHFRLWLVGAFPPYEWVSEGLSVIGLGGILLLMAVRQKQHPRSQGRRSRFFGSTFWQAYFVELVILGVMVCILLLRSLEYAIDHEHGNGWHYPVGQLLGSAFGGLSDSTLENLIVLVAGIKIAISMSWAITIGLNTTMGVAWHRFLAFPNIWFKRNPTPSRVGPSTTSLGPLQPISLKGEVLDFENIDELDEDAALGVGAVEKFTWKGLLDFSTCTECGRCQSQCPAWNTDKPLSPKMLIMSLRDNAYAKAPWLLASEEARKEAEAAGGAAGAPAADAGKGSLGLGGSGLDLLRSAKAVADRPLIGETGYELDNPLAAYNGGADGTGGVIDPDVLWSCVTCGACVEQCPVDIEHVDHIVDMRRYQVLIESAFPNELNGLFKNLEKNSNPWGLAPRLRMDWAKNLPFEIKQVGADIEDLSEVEYLFWVGCAGAYEDRQKKTTVAIATLLHEAQVDFAVLGDGEACTGDSARRSGNEFLFQQLALQNVEVLNESKATKIVVSCAHCFNTIQNEYPQLGGHYEVVHHTQLLNRLVREKRLTPVAPIDSPAPPVSNAGTEGSAGASSTAAPSAAPAAAPTDTAPAETAPATPAALTPVTYHDPCYIGRHNGIYEPPRELIGSLPGVELREMPRNSERAFCCGAGGARMWMEEKLGKRINTTRTEEAVATGADTIAVGCPFCRVMLSDGLTAKQSEGAAREEVQVLDVAQMLLAAVQRGKPDQAQPAK
ncbi:heterodisulfide reductase-related iron-sulfur binding cluster [Kineosporia sp. NBRC 101677]|uniref:heterodisulfide reductase-related iron-sulfur binding cluster n=1 Tax=Kineosporia sp. NBRC 101677 TaxID=3032197 RepID=UPI0025570D21|nr:heterodisulfide reductase-related iron-sulfur binding cluster [Kineosporia sp. NBRC 101677]